jgi:hypothetical protein
MEPTNPVSSDYANFHGDRVNLVLHLATVPLFLAGNVALVYFAAHASWLALAGLAAMAVAMGVQGRGHAREVNPPIPFAGPLDFAKRIFSEQWFKFPRYVVTGGLARAWRRQPATRAAS